MKSLHAKRHDLPPPMQVKRNRRGHLLHPCRTQGPIRCCNRLMVRPSSHCRTLQALTSSQQKVLYQNGTRFPSTHSYTGPCMHKSSCPPPPFSRGPCRSPRRERMSSALRKPSVNTSLLHQSLPHICCRDPEKRSLTDFLFSTSYSLKLPREARHS